MSNPFQSPQLRGLLGATANDYVSVTPSDSADLPDVAIALEIKTAGNIKITTEYQSRQSSPVPVTIAVEAGTFLCGVARVWATGLTASGVFAYYLR